MDFLVLRNGNYALKFTGEMLASIHRSFILKEIFYTLYRTNSDTLICQQVVGGLISVKESAIVATDMDDVNKFFGAKIARELFEKAGAEYFQLVY